MRVLWLVTARAGSKGLIHKNILPLGGVPLLAWRIRPALGLPGAVWLSTDSEEYAAIGRQYGAEVPFMRPAALATDAASSADVCLHAMQYAHEHGYAFDAIGLLQPTSPFVSRLSLERGMGMLMAQPEAHAAIAVKLAHPGSGLIQPLAPTLACLAERFAMQRRDIRRQTFAPEITPCGGFFIARWESFLRQPTFYAAHSIPVLLDGVEVLDIDTELDMAFAEFCVQSGQAVNIPAACR